MSFSDITPLIAGLLQFGVACYTLRLIRLFSSPRGGWPIFGALSVVAVLCCLLLPSSPFRSGVMSAMNVDFIYGVISLLLLGGMVYLEMKFKKRLEAESKQRRTQSEWEVQVEKEWEKLSQKNAELRQTIDEHLVELARSKEELRQTALKLDTQIADQRRSQIQVAEAHNLLLHASHQAGMTEVAGRLVDELAAFSLFTRQQAESAREQFARLSRHLRLSMAGESAASRNPRVRKMPVALAQLAHNLTDERNRLLARIDFVRQQLARIAPAAVAPETAAVVSPIIESALRTAPGTELAGESTDLGTTRAADSHSSEETNSLPADRAESGAVVE